MPTQPEPALSNPTPLPDAARSDDGSRGEFDVIARYFAPLAQGVDAALGLRDDAAVLSVPAGRDLVVTADAIVAGVHFLPEDPARLVARKLVRVNYSDLAAMGAAPLGHVITLTLPAVCRRTTWLSSFARGLAEDQAALGGVLFGGDTTATPGPLSLSLTAFGIVRAGYALRRDRARPGDRIYVSGTLGDAAVGLRILLRRRDGMAAELDGEHAAWLIDRYRVPQPRLALGRALAALQPPGRIAAMDVSDGLAGDLAHICRASGVAAEISWPALPRSVAAHAASSVLLDLAPDLIVSGDDYELLFTAPPELADAIDAAATETATAVTCIGTILPGSQVAADMPVWFRGEDGGTMTVGGGYRHF